MSEVVIEDKKETFEKKPLPKVEEKVSAKEKKGVHVSKKKKEEVVELTKLFNEYDTIALVDLLALPSHQLQVMRKKIVDYAVIKVTKKRLIIKALEKIEKKDIGKLVGNLEEVMPAVIFSKENAFKLASLLRKNKSKVAAKPGQKAPRDISINAGPTPFTPGPIIGELASMGVKAAVEEGKIVVKEDTVVVKEGEEINAQVADLLVKLDVKPMEIGLNLVAAYEGGLILDKKILDFDETIYVDQIKQIASDAFKLTIGVGYVTKDNILILLSKAENETNALIDAAGIITGDSVKKMLGKASKEAENLLGKDSPKEIEEEKKEEKPVEEEKLKGEEKTEDLKEEKKEEKVEDSSEEKKKMDVVIEDKKEEEKVPTAEELAERKKQKEEEEKLAEKASEKEEENVPSLHELAEKPKEEDKEDVPSAHELAEKKKDNTNKEEN